MEKIIEQAILYDFYGELLTEKQKEIFEDYVFNDLSLSEIAEDKNMTRQGVHDSIKRSNKALIEYEDKLKLVEKFNQIKKLVNDIHYLSDINKIREISSHILDQI